MILFANTNRFKDDYLSSSANIVLPKAINSYRLIMPYISKGLNSLYRPTLLYKKSGIFVSELIKNEHQTHDLFDNEVEIKDDHILNTLKKIKGRFGKNSIGISTLKLSDSWKMNNKLCSKRYTTNFEELLTIS